MLNKLKELLATLRQYVHFGRAQNPVPTDSKIIGVMELSKKQQDEYRKHRRRKILLRTSPFIALVVFIALWFILPAPLTHQAIQNYNRKDDKTARNWLTPLTWTSATPFAIEPFVIAFNSGTVDTRLGNYKIAQEELERALKLAPADKRCMVVQNLHYSLTAHANSLKGKSEATKYSDQAKKLKADNVKCFQIIVSKDKKPDPENEGGGGGGGGSESESPNPAQEQELLEKNKEGQASQQPNINQLIIDLSSPSVKPW